MPLKGTDALVEARIREARERGDFEDLPGEGEPLKLDDLPGLTPEECFEALFLRSCGEVAEEVSLLREIRADREALARCTDEVARERLRGELRARAAQVAALIDARRKAARRPTRP